MNIKDNKICCSVVDLVYDSVGKIFDSSVYMNSVDSSVWCSVWISVNNSVQNSINNSISMYVLNDINEYEY